MIGAALLVGACTESGGSGDARVVAAPRSTPATTTTTAAVGEAQERAGAPDTGDGDGDGFGASLAQMWQSVVSAWDALPSFDVPDAVTATCGDAGDGPYSGLPGCEAGGERTTVERVVDGDTVLLDDGREVQLIGVDAPEAGTCAGDAATRHVRARVLDRSIVLHTEPGAGRDRSGRPLHYVRYDVPDDQYDLGYSLAFNGLAVSYPAYRGNDRYMANIAEAVAGAPAPPRCPAPSTPQGEPDDDHRTAAAASPAPRPAVGMPAATTVRAPAPRDDGAAYFTNCSAARAAGAAPIRRGEPGYRSALDRDDDGVACE